MMTLSFAPQWGEIVWFSRYFRACEVGQRLSTFVEVVMAHGRADVLLVEAYADLRALFAIVLESALLQVEAAATARDVPPPLWHAAQVIVMDEDAYDQLERCVGTAFAMPIIVMATKHPRRFPRAAAVLRAPVNHEALVEAVLRYSTAGQSS